ncbi:hypothetical protein BGZ74_007580 [Mortierella antarctica]|nr:hypothetical protein BGZ74_007580 [Mortierella antarctica]
MPPAKKSKTKKSDMDFSDKDMDAFLGISFGMDGIDVGQIPAQPVKVKRLKIAPNALPRDHLKRGITGLFPLFVHNKIIFNKSSNHNIHLELLGQALRRTLLQRDYQRAYRLYSKMIGIKGVDEEAWWKIGAELLRQKTEYEPNCIQFLKTMFAKAIICRIPVLIETALYMMRCGRFEEAHETMEPHADATPYSADSKYQGTLGLVEFALWQKGLDTVRSTIQDKRGGGGGGDRRSTTGDSMDVDDDSSQTTLVQQDGDYDDDHEHDQEITGLKSKAQRFKLAAILHLEKALRLDGKNDLFLAHLITLRCGAVDIKGVHGKISAARMKELQEMRGYLKEFLVLNQDNLLALQLLASLETTVVEAPSRENTLTYILGLDPAADSDRYVVPWIRILTSKMTSKQAQIVEDIESTRISSNLPSTFVDQDFLASFQYRDTDPAALPLELLALVGRRRERRLVPWTETKTKGGTNKKNNIPRRRSQTDLDIDSSVLSKDRHVIFEQLDRHQPNVAYYRPVLELLLARAEYGVLTAWEEAELNRITNLFCFCSLYCRRHTSVRDLTAAAKGACAGNGLKSYFEQLPDEMRPPWYNKLVLILARADDFEVPVQPNDE